MGTYTAHWVRYKRQNLRGVLYGLLMVAAGIPGIAYVGYLLSPLTTLTTGVLVSLFVLWLGCFAALMMHFSRVTCPRCDARYSRGKYLVDCPRCGLRMLQEEP